MTRSIYFLIAIFILKFSSNAQTILGIDVSSYQGLVNWTSVKNAGYTFAWAKATEGLTVNDSQYLNNAVNGVNAGVYMGAYHFAHPDNNPTNADAISEANHFLSVAQPYIISCQLPPVLDLEVSTSLTSSQLTAWVQNWMNTVQSATGITPILYTDGSIANSLGSSLASYCKLWIADPDGSPTVSPSSTYLGVWYPNWSFKQYSWTGTVPGISGSVDLDSFNGALQGLKNLMGCTPPICNTYYATLPYSTSFETAWLTDSCAGVAQRLPDKYWKSSIGGTSSSGNDYWHRDNYSGSDWTSITSGSFSPAASAGSYSARFHNAPATASTTGALDLHINLSPAGTKNISFDFIHNESSPAPFSFLVLLSTNGGSTFPTTLLSITTASFSNWTTQTLTTSATSSTSVLRFITTDKGLQDVGIDNLQISTSAPLSSTGTQTNILCNGLLSGAAHVTPGGGTSPYAY
ncbi:MAG: glycoside hydrolase family 25 protein, partial [Bacteroidia bacterium]